MDIVGGFVSFIRVIIGILLLFFIPGYAFSWIFYPIKDSIPQMTRFAYSFVLSIVLVMLGILFIDVTLGIDTTANNIIVVIVAMSVLAILIWRIELICLNNNFWKGDIRNVSKHMFNKFDLTILKQKISDLRQNLIKRKIEK